MKKTQIKGQWDLLQTGVKRPCGKRDLEVTVITP